MKVFGWIVLVLLCIFVPFVGIPLTLWVATKVEHDQVYGPR